MKAFLPAGLALAMLSLPALGQSYGAGTSPGNNTASDRTATAPPANGGREPGTGLGAQTASSPNPVTCPSGENRPSCGETPHPQADQGGQSGKGHQPDLAAPPRNSDSTGLGGNRKAEEGKRE